MSNLILFANNSIPTILHDRDDIKSISIQDTYNISELPRLPPNLEELIIIYTDFYIKSWAHNDNCIMINNLPDLPKSLKILRCENIDFILPPELPKGLEVLIFCKNDTPMVLPELPHGLKYLKLERLNLLSTPFTIPDSVEELNVKEIMMDSMFNLPYNLKRLHIEEIGCQDITYLPPHLTHLYIKHDNIDVKLPNTLVYLKLEYCNIIPKELEVPYGVIQLLVSNTNVTEIKGFSDNIELLRLTNNKNLTKIPDIRYCKNIRDLILSDFGEEVLKIETNDKH